MTKKQERIIIGGTAYASQEAAGFAVLWGLFAGLGLVAAITCLILGPWWAVIIGIVMFLFGTWRISKGKLAKF